MNIITNPSFEDMSDCDIEAFELHFEDSESDSESVVPGYTRVNPGYYNRHPHTAVTPRGHKKGHFLQGTAETASYRGHFQGAIPAFPSSLSPISPPKWSREGTSSHRSNGYSSDPTVTTTAASSSTATVSTMPFSHRLRRGGMKLQDILISPARISMETVQLGEGLCVNSTQEEGGGGDEEDGGVGDRRRGQKRCDLLEEEEERCHAGFVCYERDIYLHRRSLERSLHPIQCLRNQPEVTLDMRTVLVEWLTKLSRHFHFGQDTLFLAVNVMDRFLKITPISRDCFQLLGVTTFLIAAKQEEVNPPEIVELVRLCCHAYNREQVKQMELIILNRLQFDLLVPTVQFFLEYYCSSRMQTGACYDYTPEQLRRTRALGRYLQEQCLQDYHVCQFQPSLLALATLEVSDGLLRHCPRPQPKYCGGHSPESIEQCCLRVKSVVRRQMEGEDLEKICEDYREAPYSS